MAESVANLRDKPRPIHVTLPPSVGANSWPWSQDAKEYRVKLGRVTKWGAWQYKFEVSFGGRTYWFSPWHWTSGPEGRGGMYGSIEQRDVWGLCLLRRLVITLVRARFAEETEHDQK